MPTNLTDREINLRIAEKLGLELGARTDVEIDCALDSFIWPDIGLETWRAAYRKMERSKIDGNPRSDYLYLWDDRQGKSYQQEIEQWVAAWRREPPDWAGDLKEANLLEPIIRERELEQDFVNELHKLTYVLGEGYSQGYLANVFASARQRSEAALLALGGNLDE